MEATHERLGDILVREHVLSPADLTRALTDQSQHGGTLGETLLRLGAVSEPQLLTALTRQTGAPPFDLVDHDIPPEVQRRVPWETVQARQVLPLAMAGTSLVLGMLDPTDVAAIQEVEFQADAAVKPVVLSARQLRRVLALCEQTGYAAATIRLPAEAVEHHRDLVSMLRTLISMRGQDLHLAAQAPPSMRVDGELHRFEATPLSGADIAELVSEILTAEQRTLFRANLELDFAHQVAGVGRFRCNLYRQRGTLTFTARHVPDHIPTMAELGLPAFVRSYALMRQGLILLTAPNGHGKSTTLACLIDIINRERRANIVTLEDPIEFVHQHRLSNVNQREVGSDTHSFAAGLRHIFRQNPDVIVFGELRDRDSIATALSAAESGHLVMATVHSINATTAINRLIDAFPDDQSHQVRAQLADALLLVLAQRLVRRASGPGRVLCWEKLATSPRLKNAIREGKVHSLRQMIQANLEELSSIDQSLAAAVAAGAIAEDEAMKWADDPHYLRDLVRLRQ